MQFPIPAQNIFTIPTGATTGARIVLDGTRGAIFVYNSNNALLASIAGVGGTDGQNNTYYPGINVYGPNGSYVQLYVDSSGQPFITMRYNSAPTNNFSYIEAKPLLGLYGIEIGAYSGVANVLNRLGWQGGANGQLILEPGSSIAASDPVAGYPQPETYHTATLLNGWTGTLAYRLTAQGDMHISADLVAGTTTNGTNIYTFPSSYRPATKKRIPASFDGAVATGGNPYFILNTDGTFTVHWVTSTQTNGGFEATVKMT